MFDNLWTLFYRHGITSTMNKTFYFKGTIVQAQERARTYCTKMKYKYLNVAPFITDMDKEEKDFLHPADNYKLLKDKETEKELVSK